MGIYLHFQGDHDEAKEKEQNHSEQGTNGDGTTTDDHTEDALVAAAAAAESTKQPKKKQGDRGFMRKRRGKVQFLGCRFEKDCTGRHCQNGLSYL